MKSIHIEKIRRFNRYYANILGRIDQEIYNKPFTLTDARVITEIHYKNGCTATEVRENLGIDRGYMSRIIQRFEEDKIIVKKQSLVDKRQYGLYLTEYGQTIFKELVDHATVGVDKMIQNLTKKELSKLVSSMETIESIYSKKNAAHSQVIIRTFVPGDVGYVAHLHGDLYSKTCQFGPIFEYYVMKGLTEFMLDHDGGELWIAEVNGNAVGSIAITKAKDSEAQLRWFLIDENYQGMGIGNKLMETALNFSKAQNYRHVFLWTVNILEPARHLYSKYNFKLTEEKANEEWTKTPLVEERWDLDFFNEI